MKNTLYFSLFFSVSMGLVTSASARTWETLKIDGGKCGNGSDYSIFISRKDPKKVAFFFQGGGACWSSATCNGPFFSTILWIPIKATPKIIQHFSILSDQPETSPISDYSIVYFPYCTGDLFSGIHIANYGGLEPVFHWGAINLKLSLEQLKESRIINSVEADEVAVYGVSAGAAGAMLSMSVLDEYLNPRQKKVAIFDSPGLHFDSSVVDRLPRNMVRDLNSSLESVGMHFDVHQPEMTQQLPMFCGKFRDWNMGILQSSRDFIMSIFGGMWPQTHKDRVYGRGGIHESLSGYGRNCSIWVPETMMHTFLLTNWTMRYEANGISAYQYANELINSTGSGAN